MNWPPRTSAGAVANAKLAERRGDDALRKQYLAVKQLSSLASQTQKALLAKADDEQIEPLLRPLREDLMKTVRRNVMQLAKEMGKSALTNAHLIQSHQALGDMFRDLGMTEQALDQYRLAYDMAATLAKERKDDDRHRGNLAVMLIRLGDMERILNADLPAANDYYQQALALELDIEANPYNHFYKPIDHKRLKAFFLHGLGRVALRQGHPVEARKYFEEVVDYRRQWAKADGKNRLAWNYLVEGDLFLGDVCWRLQDEKAARAAFDQAQNIMQQLIKQEPGEIDYKADLAEALLMYGDACLRLGKGEEAKQRFADCAKPLAEAIAKDPENVRYIELVVRKEYRQGLVAELAKDPQAADHCAAALKACRRLVAIDTANLPYQVLLTRCLARNGKTDDAIKKADALRPRVTKDPELLVQLAGCYALVAERTTEAATGNAHRGTALEIIRSLTKAGYRDRFNLATHPDLAPLASDAGFKQLVAAQ